MLPVTSSSLENVSLSVSGGVSLPSDSESITSSLVSENTVNNIICNYTERPKKIPNLAKLLTLGTIIAKNRQIFFREGTGRK